MQPRPEAIATGSDPVAPPFTFRVAILPLSIVTDQADAVRAFRAVFALFLAELRAIPNLELWELRVADETLTVDDADFVLEVATDSRSFGEPLWTFRVSWRALRGGNGSFEASESALEPEAFEAIAGIAADTLRRFPFPPQETRTIELVSNALDTTRTREERFDALDELQDIPRRFEYVGREEERIVATAAVEIVANSPDAEIRGRAWKAMADARIDDPYLTGPLVDSVLNDSSEFVRTEAVKLLARNFRDDPRASAALDYVLSRDSSADVKTHASWELLDEPARIELVKNTVFNSSLSDIERLRYLLADVSGIRRYVDQVGEAEPWRLPGSSRSPSSASENDDLPGEIAADPVTALSLEILAEEETTMMDRLAISMLLGRLDQPGVLEALERFAEQEGTPFNITWSIRTALSRMREQDARN